MNKIVTGYLKVMGLKISTAVLQASESILSNGVVQQVALSGTIAEQKALGLNRGKRILHNQKMQDYSYTMYFFNNLENSKTNVICMSYTPPKTP